MKWWEVAMFESGRLIEVRVSAPSQSKAVAKAEAVAPDAALLTVKRLLRQGA